MNTAEKYRTLANSLKRRAETAAPGTREQMLAFASHFEVLAREAKAARKRRRSSSRRAERRAA